MTAFPRLRKFSETGPGHSARRAPGRRLARRTGIFRRQHPLLVGILAAVVVGVFPSPGRVGADSTLPVTESEVGSTNPLGASDTDMFRDDELNIWGATRDAGNARFFPGAPTRDDLTAWDFNFAANGIAWDLPTGWDYRGGQTLDDSDKSDYSYPMMAIAYGRVTDPEHDQAIVAGLDANPFGNVDIQVRSADDPGTVVKSAQLKYSLYWSIDGIDVAVGDLDRVVDENGYFHDEIVVIWGPMDTFGGCNVQMVILDYNLNQIASVGMPGCTGHVATTIGDFDADGELEFAGVSNDLGGEVYGKPGAPGLWGQVCNLIFDSPGHWHVSCLAALNAGNPDGFPSVDAAAGNIFALDNEHLIIATSPRVASSVDYFRITVLGLDKDENYQTLDWWNMWTSKDPNISGTGSIPGVHEVRVGTGLFLFNPDKGYEFGYRQIATAALGVSSGNQTADVWFWDRIRSAENPVGRVLAKGHTSISGKHTAKTSLAVGNFVGHGTTGESDDPTMQAAVTYLHTTSDNLADATKVTQRSAVWKLVPPPTGSTTWSTTQAWSYSMPTNHGFDGYDPIVVTEDYDGDSWRLGIPIHIVISSAPSYQSLLEEPPRHVDYLPVNPDNPAAGYEVINISGYKDFKIELKKSGSESISSEKTDSTAWSIGSGVDLSFDYSATVKTMFGAEKITTSFSAETKIDYSYEQTVKDITSKLGHASLTWTNSTDTDDQLDVVVQDTDIWRYPIIGFETNDPNNPIGYYEVTIPGSSYDTQDGGKQHDWYAPLHVNENVLSYPQNLSGDLPWLPEDVGSFQVPTFNPDGTPVVDDDGNPVMKTVTGLMSKQVAYSWDGNEHTQDMEFSTESGTTHDKEFNGTLSEAVDIGIGISNTMKVPIPGMRTEMDMSFKGDINFNNSNSWGGEQVSSTTLSKSSGVKFFAPAISSYDQEGASYRYTSALYSTSSGGGLKVAHTILDLITAPQDWWVRQYGRKPDPALNLPFLFTHHDPDSQHANIDWWTLKTEEDDYLDIRHQMRGFFMRNNYVDPVTGNYELISGSPEDGDIVRLCVRVHNLSLSTRTTGDFNAHFYSYLWDTDGGVQVSDPVLIGVVKVASLNGLPTTNGTSMREVCVPWDTTGASHVNKTTIGYRFKVKLDEENVVDEIHELENADGTEALGGNNFGRWPWSVAIMVTTPAEASLASRRMKLINGVVQEEAPPQMVMGENNLRFKGRNGFLGTGAVQLKEGETYAVRAHFVSDAPYSGNVWVAFYDGRPNEGGKRIGLELARGVRAGDNYVWAHWTPQGRGEREVRAYIFHRVSSANRLGSDTARTVSVVGEGDATPTVTPEDEGGKNEDGCSLGSRGGGVHPLLPGLLFLAVRVFRRRPAARTC